MLKWKSFSFGRGSKKEKSLSKKMYLISLPVCPLSLTSTIFRNDKVLNCLSGTFSFFLSYEALLCSPTEKKPLNEKVSDEIKTNWRRNFLDLWMGGWGWILMNAHENENYPFSHPRKKKLFVSILSLFFRFFCSWNILEKWIHQDINLR